MKKVIDLFNEINVFNEIKQKSVEEASEWFYKYRIYICDILEEKNFSDEFIKFTNNFLENVYEIEKEEIESWKQFLEMEIK